MGIWEPLAWKNPQILASVFMCLSSSSLDFSLSLLLPTDTQRHISELQREACCVSELDLGGRRKAFSPIPSLEFLTLKGKGGRGRGGGGSFPPPHDPLYYTLSIRL